MDSFTGLNAQVLGISVDHVPCLQAWSESLGGIHYPLLSDFWPHGAVAESYGVLRHGDGITERAIFVIDKQGVIRYIDIHAIDDRPDNEEVRKVLRELEAESPSTPQRPSSDAYFAEIEAEDIPKGDIVLFCASWCKDCRKAKAWLDERALKYIEVDVDRHMAARNQVRQWANGFLITPVVQMYGSLILDFDPAKMEAALKKHTG